MKRQYNGRTYTITYDDNSGVVVATWQGYSAEAFTLEKAMSKCAEMIDNDENDSN